MALNSASSRSPRYVLWVVAIVLVVAAVAAIRSLTRERVGVLVAEVTTGDVVKTVSTNGKVQPVEDFQAHASVAGQVEDEYVKVGDQVRPGQLLLRMDDKAALANMAHAQAQLDAARLGANDIAKGGTQDERNQFAGNENRLRMQRQQDASSLAALQSLQRQGAASSGEVTAAQHRLDLDDANLRSLQQRTTQRYSNEDQTNAQAQVGDARAALAAAQNTLASSDIRTPIAGTVYYLPVATYDYVETGTDLVYVANLKHLQVTAYFDEPEIGNLAVGQPVKIVWEARRNLVWHGHIAQVPTTIIGYGNRNVGECVISVDDADGILQPNANVTVTVTTAQDLNVMRAPRESLHFDGTQAYVYRVEGDRLVKTPVTAGITNETWAEIKSGVSPGDVVARNATTNIDLSDRLKVKVVQ